MNISKGQPASHLAGSWFSKNSSDSKTGLREVNPIQTVPLGKAVFKYAGLGLSVKTTRMLGKVASHLGDNPSNMLEIRDYLGDTSKAGLGSSRKRINLVKAYLATQGVDASRFVLKGSSATRRSVPRMAAGTELIVQITGIHQLGRVDSTTTLPEEEDADAGAESAPG